jgi:outer membrane protein assembly factor BamB
LCLYWTDLSQVTIDWKRPERGEKPGTPLWQRALEGKIRKPYSSLITTRQLLITSIEKGEHRDERYSEIIVLDTQTGTPQWTRALARNRFTQFLTLAGNLLISSSEHLSVLAGARCLVQALDVQTGEPVWQNELPAHSHSAPAVLGSLLLISASDRRVYALNESDGAIAWRSPKLPNWSPAPATVGEDLVFIGGFTHVITSLTPDGKVTPLFLNENETDWFDISFAYGNGTLYAPSSDHRLHAIDAGSGQLRWSQPAGRGASAPPALGESQIFLPLKARPSGRYVLRALDLLEGETQWEFAAHKHILAPPLLNDDTLYFGSRGGMFYALNVVTGDMRWEIEIGQPVRSSPVINGSRIFFGSAEGGIHCLRWRAESQEQMLPAASYRADGEWLMAGTAAARAGHWLEAAGDFERGEYPVVAAQLYERAEAWELAAPLYAGSDHYQHALNAYDQAGDRGNMAEMHLQLRQPELAADLFADLGDCARAATIYHESGHLKRAAFQYAQAGDSEQAIKLYRALKQPESAAELAEEAGDIDGAVAIWMEIDNFERAAELLVADDRRAEGAALLESNDLIHAAAGLWSQVNEMENAGQVFERANLLIDAAGCFEQAGLTVKAAKTYLLAGEARRAADLYMSAGKLQKALTIYVQLKAYRSIAEIYVQQGQWRQAGQAYLAAKPPRYEKAASCFARIQSWLQAAQAYQDAGLVDDAVDSWLKSTTPRRGAELLRDQGRLPEAASLFAEIGNLQDAADIELELGNIKEAVTHYRKLGNDERALQVAQEYERWDIISQLARHRGDYEQEAEAALALARQSPDEDYRHYRAAAQAYVRAARHHEELEDHLVSDEAIARLWDLAARYFDEGMIEDKQLITQSMREARRMRGWPEIVLDVQAERKLAIDRWDGLIVRIKNIGYGVARHVSTKVIEGEFEGKLDTQSFAGILPGHTERIRLNVRPRSAGSSVPLYIRLSFVRPNNEEVERDISAEVPVHDRDSKSTTSESEIGRRKPIKLHQDDAYEDDKRHRTIIVQGDYITVGNVSDATVAIGESASAAETDILSPQAAETPTAQPPSASLSDLTAKINANFTRKEINVLARSLNVDYEILPGTTKLVKTYAFVEGLARSGHLEPLFALLEAQRPGVQVDWRSGFRGLEQKP